MRRSGKVKMDKGVRQRGPGLGPRPNWAKAGAVRCCGVDHARYCCPRTETEVRQVREAVWDGRCGWAGVIGWAPLGCRSKDTPHPHTLGPGRGDEEVYRWCIGGVAVIADEELCRAFASLLSRLFFFLFLPCSALVSLASLTAGSEGAEQQTTRSQRSAAQRRVAAGKLGRVSWSQMQMQMQTGADRCTLTALGAQSKAVCNSST